MFQVLAPAIIYNTGNLPEIVERVYISTATWCGRKSVDQWQHSFQIKAALLLANRLAAASDRINNTRPGLG